MNLGGPNLFGKIQGGPILGGKIVSRLVSAGTKFLGLGGDFFLKVQFET